MEKGLASIAQRRRMVAVAGEAKQMDERIVRQRIAEYPAVISPNG